MNKYIEQLLNISSEAISGNSVKTNLIPNRDILNMLDKKNGFFAFKSALHVFSSEEQNEINSLISNSSMHQEGCYYFAEDIFGNLFCEKDGDYYLLDLETGNYEFVGKSLDEFAKNILDDYNYLTGYSLADLWQSQHRPLNINERLVPKRFFVFGGEFDVDNLYAMDRINAIKLRMDLYDQLEDLSDGEHVNLDIK